MGYASRGRAAKSQSIIHQALKPLSRCRSADGKHIVVKEESAMLTMLRSTSVLLAVIAGIVASSFPAAAQSPLGKAMGEKWANSCVAEAKSAIRQAMAKGVGSSVGELTVACCRRARNDDSACKNIEKDQASRVNCQVGLETCQNVVKADPGLKADIEKAEKEKAEKEAKEKAAAAGPQNCKGVKVSNLSAGVCCTSSKGTGCVITGEDCKRLNGTEKTSPEAGCNKEFPGYTGHVTIAPSFVCADVKVATEWRLDKKFDKESSGKCKRSYTCAIKSSISLPSPVTTLCREVRSLDVAFVRSTCTDAQCSDCKATPPDDRCTITFVNK
jgi:hypothetical protein